MPRGHYSEPTDPDPCQDKGLTAYRRHFIIRDGGIGYVECVELFRKGKSQFCEVSCIIHRGPQ